MRSHRTDPGRRAWLVSTGVAIVAVAAGCGHAMPAAQRIGGEEVPPGTVLIARLDRTIGLAVPHVAGVDTAPGARTRPGELFDLFVESPLLDGQGRVVVPRGATLVGHVVAMRAPRTTDAGTKRPAEIVVAVDALRIGAIEHPIEARVIAVDPESATRGLDARRLKLGVREPERPGAILSPDGPPADEDEGGTAISLGPDATRAALTANTAFALELREPLPVASLRPAKPTASRGPTRTPLVDDLRVQQPIYPAHPGDPATPSTESPGQQSTFPPNP